MRHAIIALAAILVTALSTAASAGTYMEFNAGRAWFQDITPNDRADAAGELAGIRAGFAPGTIGTIAVGHSFSAPFRLEAEYVHAEASLNSTLAGIINPAFDPDHPLDAPFSFPFGGTITGHAVVDALMINGYADAPIGSGAVYVGIGAGAALERTSFDGVDRRETNPAAQAMLGIAVPITTTVDATVEYRLLVAEGVPIGNDSDTLLQIHSALAGLRFAF